MSFYGLDDRYILAMPARRFWALESQIARISAEGDLRAINVERATGSQDQFEEVINRLTLEIGDTCKVVINPIIKRDDGARAALESFRLSKTQAE